MKKVRGVFSLRNTRNLPGPVFHLVLSWISCVPQARKKKKSQMSVPQARPDSRACIQAPKRPRALHTCIRARKRPRALRTSIQARKRLFVACTQAYKQLHALHAVVIVWTSISDKCFVVAQALDFCCSYGYQDLGPKYKEILVPIHKHFLVVFRISQNSYTESRRTMANFTTKKYFQLKLAKNARVG